MAIATGPRGRCGRLFPRARSHWQEKTLAEDQDETGMANETDTSTGMARQPFELQANHLALLAMSVRSVVTRKR